MVRRPARQLEELLHRRAVDRLLLVDLVRPAGANRLLGVHLAHATRRARDRSFLIQWLAYGGPARAARGGSRSSDRRGARERGAPRCRARHARPGRPGQGARLPRREGAAGRCSCSGSASSASSPRPSSRTSAAGSGAPRARSAYGPRSSRRTSTSFPAAPTSPGNSGRSFPCSAPVVPADWTTLEVPRLEVEVPDEIVDGQLEALQQGVASLSPVEGRPARPGRRCRHRHRGRRRARAAELRPAGRGGPLDRGPRRQGPRAPPRGQRRGHLGGRRRQHPVGRRQAERAVREGAAAPRRQPGHRPRRSSTRSTSCGPTSPTESPICSSARWRASSAWPPWTSS